VALPLTPDQGSFATRRDAVRGIVFQVVESSALRFELTGSSSGDDTGRHGCGFGHSIGAAQTEGAFRDARFDREQPAHRMKHNAETATWTSSDLPSEDMSDIDAAVVLDTDQTTT
jgi:hypothetical protein